MNRSVIFESSYPEAKEGGTHRSIEDAYPLSSLQQGMLFHSLEPCHGGVDVQQVVYHLDEELEVGHLLTAWQAAVERHAVMRTSFCADRAEPEQVVHRHAIMPVEQRDWTLYVQEEQARRWDSLLAEDRARGFDLSQVPLTRLTLIRFGAACYRMLWTHHHILFDGRSSMAVQLEVFDHYKALKAGTPCEFLQRRPYRDYIDWLKTQDFAKDRLFWKEFLKGFRSPTPVTSAKPSGAQDRSYGSINTRLSREITAELRTFAEAHGLTVNSLVQGAWALLLHHYSGEFDIVFGATRANRYSSIAGAKDIIGPFINTLPMRVQIDPQAKLTDWLRGLRDQQLQLRDYEQTPLAVVQKSSELSDSMSLFESIIVFDNQILNTAFRALGGEWLNRQVYDFTRTNYAITVAAYNEPELTIRVAYQRWRLDDRTAQQMVRHFCLLLEGMGVAPERSLSELPLMDDREKEELLAQCGQSHKEFPEDACLHQLFEAQVEQTPDAIAVVFESKTLSYRELNRRSNQLAHYLRQHGVGAETLVGICLERSLEMVVGVLAILKAGGAYLPLDPEFPRERLQFMLEDSQTLILLTEKKLLGSETDAQIHTLKSKIQNVICVDRDGESIAQQPDENPEPNSSPHHTAYVIYTSGSTGKPKGVVIEHRSLVNFLWSMRAEPGLSDRDVLLAVTTLSFDIAGLEIYLPLIVGARLVLASREVATDGQRLGRLLQSSNATVMQATPATWRMLLASGWAGKADLQVLCGGEALARELAQQLVVKVASLWNLYGPTETTIWSALSRIEAGQEAVTLGQPIANTQIYLLDSRRRLVPLGVPGEIYIGGAGLARGYLYRPELTDERFANNPFSAVPGAKLYKTGDLGRRLADGTIEFLGRSDYQVKIRGFRIELGEIEEVLAKYPGVAVAVVVACRDTPGENTESHDADARLVAYIQADTNSAPTSEELRSYLRTRLPDYMVPSLFVFLDAMPLTANGKIDRKALPVPSCDVTVGVAAFVAPRNEVEKNLANIWRAVLKREQIGVYDNFFELGGHSLLAMQVIFRIRAQFHVELPIRFLLENPTVADLSEKLCAGDSAHSLPAIEARRELGPLPLSFAQQRLWFLDHFEPDSALYNIPLALRLKGPLDPDLLARSINAIRQRHETLRACFQAGESQPRQTIHPHSEIALPVVDLAHFAETKREEELQHLAAAEAKLPFNLAQNPLLRMRLLRLHEEDHVLLLTLHHIAADGWSLRIFFRELAACYRAFSKEQAPALSALPIQYGDYAVWQREHLQGEVIESQLAYWKKQLSNLTRLALATDRPRPSVRSYRGALYKWTIPNELFERVKTLSAQQGVSPFMTLLAAFHALLYRYSGQVDIAVGSPVAGRTRSETKDLIGVFINTLVLRADLSGEPTFCELLGRVRDMALAAFANQDLPFEKLVDTIEPGRDLSIAPLFQVMFVLQENPLASLDLPGVSVEDLESHSGQSKFDLTMSLQQESTELKGWLEYNSDLFDQATMARMAEHYGTLLQSIVAAPDGRITALTMLSEEEKAQLLDYSRPAIDRFPHNRCLHQLFEDQAARTPETVAVVCNGVSLSYHELNVRANRLARRLKQAGAGADVLVGLCAARSVELVVGMLAILKAGSAYLPLDPNYPQERLQFMLEDADVKCLLADRNNVKVCGPGTNLNILAIDRDDLSASFASAAEENNLACGAKPDNLAYVIYTSGSTGKPKGTLISHYNVVRLFQATQSWFHFNAGDVWTLFHSYAFDFSVWEIWGALLYGGKLVVVPHDVSRAPEEFAALIKEHGVTVLNQTPSAFRPLMASLSAQIRPDEMPLRQVIFGGEALEFQSLQPWFDYYGDERPQLINMYGITETTVHVTYRRVVKKDLGATASSHIGKAIPDLGVYLLDGHRQLVPVGIPGELHISGAGVARGYLRRDELTAQRFVTNPFSNDPEAKLYRSGDLARRLPNGDLEYLGRIDHQVKIRGFRIELGEIEAALHQQVGVQDAAVIAREDSPGDKRLVGYFVSDKKVKPEVLRERMRALLPDHMVPSALVPLETLPLTANGKLDRKALPAPDPQRNELRNAYLPPSSEKERVLCEIWRSVLGVSRVGTADNFFELGGDSILSIQAITRARQAGFNLATRDLFKHPTVAALAAIGSTTQVAAAEPAQVTGTVLLTPIQHWFFEQNLKEQHHWNQAFLFETPADMDADLLQTALQLVLARHESFRLRFRRTPQGWEQSYDAEVGSIAIVRKDLSELSRAAQETALVELAESLQPSLDIGAGPVVRTAHVSLGRESEGRLLMIVHHLVIDGVSWRILMEDLEAAYLALRANRDPSFAARTSSYQKWSASLHDYAQSEAVCAELDYWRNLTNGALAWLPVDGAPKAANSEFSSNSVTMSLSAEQTRRLLQQAPKALRAQIDEILLGALATAFSGWVTDDSLLVDLEGHGRDEVVATGDVSRTIGWFTSIAPTRLDLFSGGDLIEPLRQAKRALRSRPSRGLGYGALRYLSDDENVRRELAAMPQALIAFNYLGQVDQWLANSTLFRFAKESSGSWHSAQAQRRYQFEIVCAVQNGCFEVRWIYSENLHRKRTVEALAGKFLGALRQWVEQCADAAQSVLVPEDFPLVEVDRPWLDRLISQYGAIEDLYPLTPMQKLFHAMDSAQGKLGFEQWHYILKGPLDKAAFKQAWEQAVARHALLRSAFVSIELPEPLQLVLSSVSIPWIEADWRAESPAQQEEKLMTLLRDDRELGLDLSSAPLLRLSLIRTAEETYYFIWTTHHLLIDGWSWPLVFQELSAAYSARCSGTAADLPYACKFREYVDWLSQQSIEGAEQFWRQELSGITSPTRFGLHHHTSPVVSSHSAFHEESARLSESTMASLQSLARSHKVTLNTLVQAAWGLLLSRRSGERDVMFGAAFSGRPSELRGIEAMVGACVNNLPVRIHVDREAPLCDFLTAVQERQFAVSQHQYCSLEEIQRWSQVPARNRLFESLLVFQNYLVGKGAHRLGDDVAVHAIAVPETTNFPITLMVTPARDLRVKILFRAAEYSNENIRRLIGELQLVLEVMSANPHYSVGEVLSQLPQLTPALIPPPQDARPAGARRLSCDSRPLLSTEMERRVAAIWQSLFELEEIDPNANFFDLGGHSVLMVQAHKRLRDALGRELPIVKLFQYPTIRALAKFLEGEMGERSLHQQARQRGQKQKLIFGQKPQGMRQPHGRI